MATAQITPRDRLAFTLFLAVSLHAALILGVGFTGGEPELPAPTIEVTLARYSDDQAPEDADFIAQSNQQGSGTEADVQELTAETEADFQSNQPQPVRAQPTPQVEAQARRELVTTVTRSDDQAPDEAVDPQQDIATTLDMSQLSYDELAAEIASLEARIDREQQELARQPRVKRLTSVSTKSADEAAYLNAWRQKVERVGNANFPRGGVYGDLRLLVVLRYDGTLEDVRVMESSGYPLLDDAALRIVRMAAPYQSFPVEMRKQYDRLEIIRTWQFSRSGASFDS
jgi:periplasmic protein TonB